VNDEAVVKPVEKLVPNGLKPQPPMPNGPNPPNPKPHPNWAAAGSTNTAATSAAANTIMIFLNMPLIYLLNVTRWKRMKFNII
jgi:hypothetical protein